MSKLSTVSQYQVRHKSYKCVSGPRFNGPVVLHFPHFSWKYVLELLLEKTVHLYTHEGTACSGSLCQPLYTNGAPYSRTSITKSLIGVVHKS